MMMNIRGRNKFIFVFTLIFILCGCSNVVKGKIETSGNASDNELDISCESSILIRNVEMVQYNKNDNGEVEIVLANYPIESFDEYTNPSFPENITTKIFHSSIMLNGNELTEEQIESLVYNNQDDLIQLVDLPENNVNIYGLMLKDGAYISASNDWQIGELRITYYTMNIDSNKEYSVIKTK